MNELAELRQRVAELEAKDTDRKRVEEALRESHQLLEKTFASLRDAVFIIDADTTEILDCNPAASEVFGYNRQEMLGRTTAFLHVDEAWLAEFRRHLYSAVEEKGFLFLPEFRMKRKDGTVFPTEHSVMPLEDEAGKRIGWVSVVHDITERKRAEEALRESEEKYRNVVELANDGICIIQDTIVQYLNPRLAEMWGGTIGEVIGTPFTNYVHPDELAKVVDRYKRRMAGQDVTPVYETVLRRRDGSKVYAEFNAGIITYQGKPADLVFVRDITERKQAEDALRESEEKLSGILHNMSDVVWSISWPDFRHHYLSPSLEKLYGRSKQEFMDNPALFKEVTHPDDQYLTEKAMKQLTEEGEATRECRIVRPDGSIVWVCDRSKMIYDENHQPIRVEGVTQDITERKRAEEALIESERNLNVAQRIAHIGNWSWDITKNVVQWSDELFHIYGFKPGEFVPQLDSSIQHMHPDDRERVREALDAALKTKKPYDIEMRVIRPDGTERVVHAIGEVYFDNTGSPQRMFGTAQDITERKRAEEAVRRHLEQIEALWQIDKALISTLDLPEVLDTILEELERVSPYHSAGIFLFSDDTARLAAGRGFPDLERALQVSFPIQEDPLTRELLQEKRALVLADAQADERFLARGGTGYVRSWIGVPLIAKGREVGFLTLDHREPGVYDEESAKMAQAFATQAAIAIENARLYEEAQRELAERKRAQEELRQSYVKLQAALEGTVNVLVSAVEMRDPYTAGHQRQVTQLACAIAKEMGLPQEQIEGLRMAGLIHDVGKIGVPAEVLSKPGPLTALQYGLIQAHPQVGHDILNGAIEFPWPVAQIVLQHHERMNGSGYPRGLSGQEIMLEARILAVADVVEAMASHRPYRPAHTLDKALEEISQNRGVLYDPEVVDVCLKLFTEKGFEFA
ncbi:MAG: PAS domain S-box protein [Chloroflexi bacterium]|nr:PAS domain S-box protein [Chloroflexota bacterium]